VIGQNRSRHYRRLVNSSSAVTASVRIRRSELRRLLAGGGLTDTVVGKRFGRHLRGGVRSARARCVVRHPGVVTQNQIFDLLIEITNRSSRPALYTSLICSSVWPRLRRFQQ